MTFKKCQICYDSDQDLAKWNKKLCLTKSKMMLVSRDFFIAV